MPLGYETYKGLLERLLELLKAQFGDDLLSLCVFGSVARGEASKESDIDLIVVHRIDKPMDKFIKVLKELRADIEYQNLCLQGFIPDPYVVFLTEQELKKNPWVLLDVVEDGIILFDCDGIFKKHLARLKRKLARLGSKRIFLPDGTWYWDLKPDWKPGEVVKL